MSYLCRLSALARLMVPTRRIGLCLTLSALCWFLSVTLAPRASASPWATRGNAALAGMLSADQRGRLGYDSVGFLGALSVTRELVPYLGVLASLRGGTFLSGGPAGGVVGLSGGLSLRGKEDALVPYASLELGCAFTGELRRPWLSAAFGLDFRVTRALALGPIVGVDDVVQRNDRGTSTDAVFMWVGISFRYWPAPAPKAPKPKPAPPPEEPVFAPAAQAVDDKELRTLIERSIESPPVRHELLAPVLFGNDSALLEPQGIAMLHEVARTLKARKDILLVEIRGYADLRGSEAHNRVLSEERARQVEGWLIEHGISPSRLRVVAEGEREPVEIGGSDGEQAQNRRVVFRILETSEP
jgi:outer membrane protein OmpA-like peptidoglycan-associated protein